MAGGLGFHPELVVKKKERERSGRQVFSSAAEGLYSRRQAATMILAGRWHRAASAGTRSCFRVWGRRRREKMGWVELGRRGEEKERLGWLSAQNREEGFFPSKVFSIFCFQRSFAILQNILQIQNCL
jgi:hypothetical protein